MHPVSSQKSVKVLFLAAEAEHFIKVGGVGDVAYGLPNAINQLKTNRVDVRLALPDHAFLHQKLGFKSKGLDFSIPYRDGKIPASIFEGTYHNLTVYLISGFPEISFELPVYNNDNLINGKKYFFFCLAALEMMRFIEWKPDIIHANDWQTAVAVYQLEKLRHIDSVYKNIRSILTIHNLAYMGSGSETELSEFGIQPPSISVLPDWANKLPLPLGLLAADRVVTVSPSYAREIQTKTYGYGLESLLKTRKRQNRFSALLNGLDQNNWNPATDSEINKGYNVEHLDDRRVNKIFLTRYLQLDPDPDIPLITMISRLDTQKGIDLAITALSHLQGIPWQAIFLLGENGGKRIPVLEAYRKKVWDFAGRNPSRVRTIFENNDSLAHQLVSGADFLLIPSRYEPCGLTQMIAMRYGCVPIARATGGLLDTIIDYSEMPKATGFLFRNRKAADLSEAIKKALLFYSNKDAWQPLQINGMNQDFSWEQSANGYAELYCQLIKYKTDNLL